MCTLLITKLNANCNIFLFSQLKLFISKNHNVR